MFIVLASLTVLRNEREDTIYSGAPHQTMSRDHARRYINGKENSFCVPHYHMAPYALFQLFDYYCYGAFSTHVFMNYMYILNLGVIFFLQKKVSFLKLSQNI